jgi:uncharacterized protein (TIGR03435 family)
MIREYILVGAFLLCGQETLAQKPAFEVVSIKPNNSGMANAGMGPRGEFFVGTNVTLKTLLIYAYSPLRGQIMNGQFVGLPNWADTDHFDIEAKPGGSARVVPSEQLKTMVQSLLEDRFRLRLHREIRNLPVYSLVVARKGPTASKDQTPPDPRHAFISVGGEAEPKSLPRGTLRKIKEKTSTKVIGRAVTIPTLILLLQQESDRMIIDNTDFHKLIDVSLEFSNDLAPDSPARGFEDTFDQQVRSLFTAVQDIGLTLKPAKALLQVLIIDSVLRPSAN